MVPQHARHAIARTLAPQRNDDFLPRGLQRLNVGYDGFENVDGGVRPLGREIPPLPRAGIDDIDGLVGHRKRRQPHQHVFTDALRPFVRRQIKPVGRKRLVDRTAAGMLDGLAPRLVVVRDLLETLVRCVLALRLNGDGRAIEIIE